MPAPTEGEWILRPLKSPGLPPVVPLLDEAKTLGRDPSNQVVVDPRHYPFVSSHHARIALEDGKPVVHDLGSRNGTLVNGKAVEQHTLQSGDIVQLGEHGPRFAVVYAADLDDTLEVVASRPMSERRFGHSTIANLRALLGVATEGDIEEAVGEEARKTRWTALGVGVAVLLLAGWGIQYALESGREETSSLREMNEKLRAEVSAARRDIQRQENAAQNARTTLERERAQLLERLAEMENEGRTATEQVAALRGQLDVTNERLAMYDPVSLEKERLAEVAAVQRAVVLIEAVSYYRDTRSRRRLYVDKDEAGRDVPNLDFRGKLYAQESSGSGFCVSDAGHVLTNAHVVLPAGAEARVEGGDGFQFVVETELAVVFTGESVRHRAEVLAVRTAVDEDLALVKIEPFEGLPYLAEFTTDAPEASAGEGVYLFGFPLGKLALQEGDRVVASTFKGILSRSVGGFLQIDAAVHPGNSGGPVTDRQGRVLGLVSRVQSLPGGPIAPSIGYVIPVARAKAIWPPGPE